MPRQRGGEPSAMTDQVSVAAEAEPRGISAIPVTPVAHGSLGDEVAHTLRTMIISGRLARGTHLVEAALAARFEVSRGPIRDALRVVEAEGLVESRRRGVYVTGHTVEDLEELYSLREAIESLALRLAVGRASPGEWVVAERAVETMRQAAAAEDPDAFAAADLEFHSEFYRLSRHRRVWSVWEQYRPTLAAVFSVTNSNKHDLPKNSARHAKILAAARRGDVEQAVRLLVRSNRTGLSERKKDLPAVEGHAPG